jgi:hypothetical protein
MGMAIEETKPEWKRCFREALRYCKEEWIQSSLEIWMDSKEQPL